MCEKNYENASLLKKTNKLRQFAILCF